MLYILLKALLTLVHYRKYSTQVWYRAKYSTRQKSSVLTGLIYESGDANKEVIVYHNPECRDGSDKTNAYS